jgi:hypothetical protein
MGVSPFIKGISKKEETIEYRLVTIQNQNICFGEIF